MPDLAAARRRPALTLLKRTAVLVAMAISFFPIFWLFSTSFKPVDEWASWPPVWVPRQPTLQNYRIVFFPEAARTFAEAQKGSLDYKVSGSAWKAFGDSRADRHGVHGILGTVRHARGLVDRPLPYGWRQPPAPVPQRPDVPADRGRGADRRDVLGAATVRHLSSA